MGDRALVIFTATDGEITEVSPTVYLHWAGNAVPEYMKELATLMGDRKDDVSYAAARFCGIAHSKHVDALSLGLWNTSEETKKAVIEGDKKYLDEHSHGDAGVVVVDCKDFSYKVYGGYLKNKKAA